MQLRGLVLRQHLVKSVHAITQECVQYQVEVWRQPLLGCGAVWSSGCWATDHGACGGLSSPPMLMAVD